MLIQNSNKQANESTHNYTIRMYPRDYKMQKWNKEDTATLIFQLIMQKSQEQNTKKQTIVLISMIKQTNKHMSVCAAK